MGIPKLNKLLVEQCSQQSIYKIHLQSLSGKKVAVDISIYLYRFLSDGNFMEHLYLFLSIFKFYNIEPIFVFDGKPPAEKNGTIQRRKDDRKEANNDYNELEKLLVNATDEERIEIEKKMSSLKRKMVRVRWAQIDKTIELIEAYGFKYYLAPHEADQLCIYLNHIGEVHAIVSDDMDMIVAGCSHVIRSINMSTREAMFYDTEKILIDMKLTKDEFIQIAVLSGTDYELSENKPSIPIKRCYEYHRKYKSENNDRTTFYEWLVNNNLRTNCDDLINICKLFDISYSINEMHEFVESKKMSKPRLSVSAIKSIMQNYNFIFV
jgi:flap endonuclease-1